MSGLYNINVSEARGQVAVSADIDQLAIVLGCSSSGSGLSSFYLSAASAVAGVGKGDAVDDLCQIIEQIQPDGGVPKRPCAFYTLPVVTVASYGTVDSSGKTGTSAVTADATSYPYGTYEVYLRVVNGGTIGTAGITFVWSLDGGRTVSRTTALGTAVTYTIADGNVKLDFGTGTLVAGDIIRVRTIAPAPDVAGLSAALAAIAAASVQCGVIVCSFEFTAALGAALSTGKAAMIAAGKRCLYLTRTRLPDAATSETEAAWLADAASDFAAYSDSAVATVAIYGLLTDAYSSRQYLRPALGQFAADLVRVPRSQWFDSPSDRKMANFSLVDANGVTVGHDDGPRGAATGLSNDTLGNRFCCVQRLPDASRLEDVFTTVPWVMYAADERIRNIPTRRVCNAIERVAVTAGTSIAGGTVRYTPAAGATPAMLTDGARRAIHGIIFDALSAEFKDDISNPNDAALDTGLVQVQQSVTVSGGNLLAVSVTLAPVVFGYLQTLNIILAVQQ